MVRQLKRPPSYQVIMLNDDVTPMEFVLHILTAIFHHGTTEAAALTMQVHEKGSAICGVYTRDIAETKVEQVLGVAREAGHPLMCMTQRE